MSTNDSRVDLVVTRDAQGAYVKASGRFLPRASADLSAWGAALHLAAGRTLTLDLCGVVRMDAAGLGMLATLTTEARRADGDLRLVSAPPRVRRLLEVTGLHRVMAGDEPAARASRLPCEPLPPRYYQRRRGGLAASPRPHTSA
jgi:anti-sigma B factor antagonist